ncbi:MAG: DUF6240 domain-containing protein [Clostridium sp.]|nr:DUF6240 domain-containing protein [Clostridium sp.]MCM1399601.1 DUF6240 domain-containing protein [Clostridium sp.]MCM1460155.1 DUF6240 domain-containing protein [Bacteroides sp.]
MGNVIDNNVIKANAAYAKNNEIPSANYDRNIEAEPVKPEESLSYIFDGEKSEDRRTISTENHFEDYLNAQREKAKQDGIDSKSKEKEDKEAAKELRNSLSSEEIKKLEMMGIDLQGATLSDLMGIVNTMRSNEHKEELSKLFAEIKASDGDVEHLNVVGGSVRVAGTNAELDSVSVSDVVAASEAEKKQAGVNEKNNINNQNIDADKKTADDKISASKTEGSTSAGEQFDISNNELVYILKNNIAVTKENIYKAHYSGSRQEKSNTATQLVDSMKGQIDRILEQAGYGNDPAKYECAKFMMDNHLLFNTDTVKTYMEYQKLVGTDIREAELPVTDVEAASQAGEQLYEKVEAIRFDVVYAMAKNGKEVTIATAYNESTAAKANNTFLDEDDREIIKKYIADDIDSTADNGLTEEQLKAVVAMRQMEEIRLSMTVSAAGRLAKMDINIDTRELTRVIDALKAVENHMVEQKLYDAGAEVTEANIEIYKSLEQNVTSLGNAHAKVLGAPLMDGEYTVHGLLMADDTEAEKGAGFEKVRRSYEALQTAPRSDMGDSITKAFSNVDDILADLGYEITAETQRAVRILGYNSIEITPDNINQIINYDRQVNELVETFYPEAVLGMIKEGINPLDVSIDELVDTVRAHNYNEGVTEAENFATYLMDVEKQGNISKEERESYIGIYRVMNQLAKSKDREAGWIFANGSRLTIRNLVSAMRSRRAAGIDVGIDDNVGFLESGSISNGITEQIERAFTDDAEAVKEFAALPQQVEDFMIENNISYTMTNAFAVNAMLGTDNGIYDMVSQVIAKLKFDTNTTEYAVDEETENIYKSLMGDDVEIDFSMNGILDALENGGDISYKYSDMRDEITRMMYSAGASGIISAKDISAIKTVNAGLNIVSAMAKESNYQIPVDTTQGTKLMNLKIKSDGESRGTIELSIKGEEMGSISAKIILSDAGSLTGYVESTTSAGNYALMAASEEFQSYMSKEGFDGDGIQMGARTRSVSSKGYTGDGAHMYKASVALVKAVGNILR